MDTSSGKWKQLAMGPLGLFVMFAFSLSDNIMTDFFIYNTCKTRPDLNASECDLLHQNSSSAEAINIEKMVQPHVGFILTIKTSIQTVFPSIMALFLGPWSDRNGRKPLLIFPFIGQTILYVMYAVLSTIKVNTYWYLLPTIPAVLLGGYPAILLTMVCYISDVTNEDNRAWYLACFYTISFIGTLLGIFVSPYIYKTTNYLTIFAISGTLCFFLIIYSIFCVEETVINENKRTFKSIFNVFLVKELFEVVLKKRDGFDICLIWICMICMALHVCAMEGNYSVLFLFTSFKLSWNISEFSIYTGTHLVISVVGMLFLIKFAGSILKLPEIAVVVIACLSNSASSVMRAFASKAWHMYLSSGIGIFTAATTPVLRSVLSKSVRQQDIGKVFSLSTILELITPFATTPVYLFVYTNTLNRFPVPVWLMSSVLPFIILLLTIFIQCRLRKLQSAQYTSLVSEEINQ